jgi:hypothetical protein
MTSFLVRHNQVDPFVAKGHSAEQAPLAGRKEAGRQLCPLITQTKTDHCESARRGGL